jgi:DNA-binding NarL/FixJ family response regulator
VHNNKISYTIKFILFKLYVRNDPTIIISDMKKITNVIIAHEFSLIRRGLSEILKDEPSVRLMAVASTGKDLLLYANEFHPDIIIMDVIFSGTEDMQLIKILADKYPHMQIIALPRLDNPINVDEIMDGGAKGLLSQLSGPREINQCIKTVQAGNKYYCYRTLEKLKMPHKTTSLIRAKALLDVLFNTN